MAKSPKTYCPLDVWVVDKHLPSKWSPGTTTCGSATSPGPGTDYLKGDLLSQGSRGYRIFEELTTSLQRQQSSPREPPRHHISPDQHCYFILRWHQSWQAPWPTEDWVFQTIIEFTYRHLDIPDPTLQATICSFSTSFASYFAWECVHTRTFTCTIIPSRIWALTSTKAPHSNK